jgi:hypothetical protein
LHAWHAKDLAFAGSSDAIAALRTSAATGPQVI